MAMSSTERGRAMRERRQQAIEAADEAEFMLRPADQLLAPSVEQTLTALELKDQDAAVAALARYYARTIDHARDPAWAARWLMPLLGDALASLNATPAARSKLRQGSRPEGPRVPSRLDELRRARRQTQGRPGA